MFDGRNLRSHFVRIAAFGLVSAVLAVAPATAQSPPPPQAPAKAAGPPMAALRGQLRAARLTPEQRQRVREIVQSHQSEFKALSDKAKALREARKAGGQVAREDLRDLIAKRQALTKTLRQEIAKVLTPEQQRRVKMLRRFLVRRWARR